MKNEYLIVNKKILPDYFEKVVAARELLSEGVIKEVSEAVKRVGISRSTYYKYKDYVFKPSTDSLCSKAVFSFLLSHEKGTLSQLLNSLTGLGANILTIMQSPPISGRASVVVTLDISNMTLATDNVLLELSKLDGIEKVRLIDVE